MEKLGRPPSQGSPPSTPSSGAHGQSPGCFLRGSKELWVGSMGWALPHCMVTQ